DSDRSEEINDKLQEYKESREILKQQIEEEKRDLEEKARDLKEKEREFNKTIDSTIIRRTTQVDEKPTILPKEKSKTSQLYLANILMDKFSI
ncbi:MAG: hypothetical protein ACOVO1_07095, partial [Chitinophagaceae bacterium]